MGIVSTKVLPTAHPNMTSKNHLTTDGEMVNEQSNDVTQIIKANHFQQTTADMGHRSEITNHVARIDVLAIQVWMGQRGITKDWYREFMTDEKLLKEFLNDPDNKAWRTRLGKI